MLVRSAEVAEPTEVVALDGLDAATNCGSSREYQRSFRFGYRSLASSCTQSQRSARPAKAASCRIVATGSATRAS